MLDQLDFTDPTYNLEKFMILVVLLIYTYFREQN